MRFADEIVKYGRAYSGLRIAMCSALLMVCLYCDVFWKACDLDECFRQDECNQTA